MQQIHVTKQTFCGQEVERASLSLFTKGPGFDPWRGEKLLGLTHIEACTG